MGDLTGDLDSILHTGTQPLLIGPFCRMAVSSLLLVAAICFL